MAGENNHVRIRPATRDDLPAIVAMRDDLNALERQGCQHASIKSLSLAEFTAIWGASLSDERFCWRIVEHEGRRVGFGLIYLVSPLTKPPIAFLHWAYLEPAARRQGLGRLLSDALLQWAQDQGADRVELQFIDGNHPAERFWSEMGFRPYARRCVRYLER